MLYVNSESLALLTRIIYSMKKVEQIGFFMFLCVLSVNVFAQNNEADRLSFLISWTPEYWGPNDGKLRFDAILPVNFESLIRYKPFRRLSFSTGLGFQRFVMSGLSWPEYSVIDVNRSYKWIFKEFRIPVQANFHLSESKANVDTYLKAEYTNEFTFSKSTYYEYDIISSTRTNSWYSSSIGLGVGSIFRANKSIGILIEGSLGTVLDKDVLFQVYIITLKLGIVLK